MSQSSSFSNTQRTITWNQYGKHITPQDCWILIDSYVYNVSDYLVEHPGGDDILIKYSGIDATVPFNQQSHSSYAISLRNARRVGKIESETYSEEYRLELQGKKKEMKKKLKMQRLGGRGGISMFREDITMGEVAQHNSENSLWVVIEGQVYDVTQYLEDHPGGESILLKNAGKDGSKAFSQAVHSWTAKEKTKKFCIGRVKKSGQGKDKIIVLGVFILMILLGGWFFMNDGKKLWLESES